MTTLYAIDHGKLIRVFTKVDSMERGIAGEANVAVWPGEEFGGLSFDQWRSIAKTTGWIDSDALADV